VREWLERLEAEDDPLVPLAYLAGQDVTLDEHELHGARRRAVLLLATGGDPLRGLALDGRAVTALAADIDGPEARTELATGLAALRRAAAGLPRVAAALARLAADPELAWRAFAAALLAAELDE
jgi:hypothetical protein